MYRNQNIIIYSMFRKLFSFGIYRISGEAAKKAQKYFRTKPAYYNAFESTTGRNGREIGANVRAEP